MPTYEYRCTKCGEHLEVYQSFSDDPLTKHDVCGGKLNKVLGSVGIVFKGSGFYRTDNRGGAKGGSREKEKESSTSGSKSETSSGSKSETSGSKETKVSKSDSGSGSKSDTGSASKSTEAKTA